MKFNMKVELLDFLRISIEFWDILDLLLGNFEYSIWQHCVRCKKVTERTKGRTTIEMINSNNKEELRKARKRMEEYLEMREKRKV